MQEVTIHDSFGKALAKYSEGLDVGLEIGEELGMVRLNVFGQKSYSASRIIQTASVGIQ